MQVFLECLGTFGVNRVTFPAHVYRSQQAGTGQRNDRQALYETAALMPNGDDGGLAEDFLRARRNWWRHMNDT